jgi:hypothetical protein
MGQNIMLASRLSGVEIQLQDIGPAAEGLEELVTTPVPEEVEEE